MSRPEFWMVWRFHGILCFHFYFILFCLFVCLEVTLLGKDTWIRATSATAMVIFSKVLFRKLLDHSYVKVFSQQLGGTSTTEFWSTPYSWRFMYMDKRYMLILSSKLVNIMKPKSTKVLWKLSYLFLKKKLVFKSNPVFIDILESC